ncbi:MAG: hypothetical protein PHV20_09575 [Bacteroidales bacterium]|nr:hypothetical protein [Bacteroidales bacterium]
MKTLLCLFLFVFGFHVLSFGESPDSITAKPHKKYWYDLGLVGGYGFSGGSHQKGDFLDGYLVGASMNWKSNENLYKVRCNYGAEIQIIGIRHPNEFLLDISGLVGRELVDHRLHLAFWGGLGLLTNNQRGEFIRQNPGWFSDSYYKSTIYIEPVIPLEISLSLYTSRKFGVGCNAVAGVTPQYFYYGLMLKLIFGNL